MKEEFNPKTIIDKESVKLIPLWKLQKLRNRWRNKVHKSKMTNGATLAKYKRKRAMARDRSWQRNLTIKADVIEVELIMRRAAGEIPSNDLLFHQFAPGAKIVPHACFS